MDKESVTPEVLKDWLQRAKTNYYEPVVNSLFNSCTKKVTGTGITFPTMKSHGFRPN